MPVLGLALLENGGPLWLAALALDLVVLGVHAWRTSSPLVVLAAGVLVAVAVTATWILVVYARTCGSSSAAGIVEWIGAVVIALRLGAWGVLHGLRILWVTPLAAVCAGGWVVLAAHLLPGGAGSCLS